MSENNQPNPENLSEIQEVEVPQFQSRIPAYLLEGKSESEQFILNEVSKMGHFCEWIAPVVVETRAQARRTNGRTRKLEANVGDLDLQKELQKSRDFRKMLCSWWVLAGGIFAAIGAIAGIVEVVKFAAEKMPK